jgi:hypothetical protein
MMIPWIRAGLELEASLDLQSRMASEVADVPERIGLAFEEGDDYGPAGSETWKGFLEEGDEELCRC